MRPDLEKLLAGLPAPDARALVAEIVKLMGGLGGLASFIWKELQNAPAGGMTRAKILGLIIDTVNFTTDRNAVEDLGNLSEAEIEAEIRRHLEKKAQAATAATAEHGERHSRADAPADPARP